jgi:glycosyltransferase involved in cell wall biosynthesis
MRQLRILVLFGTIPLHGQERANIQVMKSLSEAGAEILFLTNDEYGHESIQPMLDALGLSWIEGRFPRLLGKSWSPVEWVNRLYRISRYNLAVLNAIRSFRPTHMHIANETFLLAALPALSISSVPVVLRLGDAPRSHLPVFRWLWRNVYSARIDSIVCNSNFVAARLRHVAPDLAPSVIRNFPPVRPFRSEGNIPFLDARPTVAYVGQLSRDKGVGLLFEAAVEVLNSGSSARFVFAGDYEWRNEFARTLIDRAADLGYEDRIIFPGFIEDVPSLLAASNVHVCPSLIDEALPNTIVEAKCAGVPTVAFPSGGIPELINHGVDGYLCASKTHSELVKGLRFYLDGGLDFMSEHGKAARMSLEGLGITKTKFTEQWVHVYKSSG